MVDRMLTITEALELTGGVPSRPTFIKLLRRSPEMKAREYANEWHMPMSRLYAKLKLEGRFDDEVENRMLTIDECAYLMGVRARTIENMLKKGTLVNDEGDELGVSLGEIKKDWRISYNEVADWLGLQVNFRGGQGGSERVED